MQYKQKKKSAFLAWINRMNRMGPTSPERSSILFILYIHVTSLVFLFVLAAAAKSPALAAQALKFEVASVKPASPIDPQKPMGGQVGRMKVDQARLDITGMHLADMICTAFRVKPYQVAGPSWHDLGPTGGPRFDAAATIPGGARGEIGKVSG